VHHPPGPRQHEKNKQCRGKETSDPDRSVHVTDTRGQRHHIDHIKWLIQAEERIARAMAKAPACHARNTFNSFGSLATFTAMRRARQAAWLLSEHGSGTILSRQSLTGFKVHKSDRLIASCKSWSEFWEVARNLPTVEITLKASAGTHA
jgi:hypothetical protein